MTPTVRVAPRIVRAPWEPAPSGRRWQVGRESDLLPEPGPLALYRSVWPHRHVVWNSKRQLWEVRGLNELTGSDERVELLYWYDAPPDPETGAPRGDDEVNAMIESRSPHLVRRYQAFDHEFVWRRIRERSEFLADPERYSDKVQRRNVERRRRRRRDTAREMAAGWNDIKGWIPYLEAKQNGATEGEAKTLVTPSIRVGIDLGAQTSRTTT